MNINNLLSGGPAPTPAKPPPPPPPQVQPPSHHQVQQHHQHQQSLPSTPVQGIPAQSFRDYGNPPQASPTRGITQEYSGHQRQSSAPYGSPQGYQQHQGPYAGRPAPPPLQPVSNDPRSPGAASVLGPGPSPYRPTPTSSISSASGGYPFPPGPQMPASPGQRHQYPPTGGYPGREGYSQPGGGAPGANNPYPQAPSIPQTPPVGTPGGTHPYLQQRNSSAYSATPTSATAQQQQQYGAPFGSPLSTNHPPPPYPEFGRPQSQPPTPLGPPPRQSSGTQGFAQPASPYQQRLPSAGSGYPPNLIHHPQASPSAPAPPSIPRVPSNHSIYDNPIRAESSRGSRSQSERDRSLSVSPKTRILSLPSSSGLPGASIPESDPRSNPAVSMQAAAPSTMDSGRHVDRFERAATPNKRKLDDRDLDREELEKRDVRPAPFSTPNGAVKQERDAQQISRPREQQRPAPPVAATRRPVRYAAIPSWAQLYRDGMQLKKPNFVLRKPLHNVGTQSNGKPGSISKHDLTSRQTSPEEKRSAAPPAVTQPVDELPNARGPLGPWESCISGTPPADDVATRVADFLFLNVLRNPDFGEITSRNIQFEIEAKVGILLNKDTNERVNLPVLSECVLDNTAGRIAFQSNMSEAQHRAFNNYFNDLVLETHPDNVKRKGPRVPVFYRHRRETDKFFELSPALRKQLPACVQHRIPAKHSAKVRVTYDQTNGQVIAKIIKARVADLDLFMPMCPFDCRISVNLEMDWDGTVEELQREALTPESSQDRKKDRLSYSQTHYQIDLTQVTQTAAGLHNAQQVKKEHEIEIEVSSKSVMEQGRLAAEGQPHQYDVLVEGFVNNVRHLARKARQFVGPP